MKVLKIIGVGLVLVCLLTGVSTSKRFKPTPKQLPGESKWDYQRRIEKWHQAERERVEEIRDIVREERERYQWEQEYSEYLLPPSDSGVAAGPTVSAEAISILAKEVESLRKQLKALRNEIDQRFKKQRQVEVVHWRRFLDLEKKVNRLTEKNGE